jgi:branched-chain amino acid transport system permease protein
VAWLSARARSRTLPSGMMVLAILGIMSVVHVDMTARYLLTLGMAYAIAAVGLDIFSGYAGQPFFGQAGFMAVGAYAATIFRTRTHLSLGVAVVLTLLLVAAIAVVLGVAMVRLTHFGSALVTFFFAFVVYTLLNGSHLVGLTGGTVGLFVPTVKLWGLQFGRGLPLYVATWILLLLTVVVSHNFANSRSGRALRQVKESELVAGVLGINVTWMKLAAFVYAVVLGAIGGIVVALAAGYLYPGSFDPNESVIIFAMAAVGGLGTVVGPILGAFLFAVLPNYLGLAGGAQETVFAAVLLAVLIFMPGGLYGAVDWIAGRARSASRGATRGAGDRWSPKWIRSREAPAPHAAPTGATYGGALSIRNIQVRYGGAVALDDVSLEVRRESVHAVIGPNGAGKTTLLNCVSAVERRSTGSIDIDGVRISGVRSRQARRTGVARTFQQPALVGDLTALENAALGIFAVREWGLWRDLAGWPLTATRERDVKRMAHEYLSRVNFPPSRRTTLASSLTLGEQKLVDVARALGAESKVLLLDEPTAGLSEPESATVKEALQHLRDEHGVTMVLVSHDLDFIVGLADYVTVLDFGKILVQGDTAEVLNNEDVISAFIGRTQQPVDGRPSHQQLEESADERASYPRP